MKKLLTTALSLAMISSASMAMPIATASAQGSSSNQLVEFCKDIHEASGGEISLGRCVNLRQRFVVELCGDLVRLGILERAGFRSRGDCISDLRNTLYD